MTKRAGGVLHPVNAGCLALSAAFALATAPLYPLVGLHVDWGSGSSVLAATGGVGALWAYHLRVPGRPNEWVVTELLAAIFALALFSNVASTAQYLAVAMNRPLIDPLLASADRWFGVDVSVLAAWTRAHPRIGLLLTLAYFSLLPQFAATPIILALWKRDREGLWEYIFHFHFCGLVTVLCLALFPAACAFTYLQFESALPQGRFIAHFSGLRDGSLRRIRFNDIEGLISMPSFHVAGALMATWAVRNNLGLLAVYGVLNAMLIAATVLTGAHYAIDILASAALFALSVWCYRRLVSRRGDASQPAQAAVDTPAGGRR